MAIQLRRGAYSDFDPEKMLPGELAVVTSGDPGADDGRSVYACFVAGDVKRMATYEDMEENIDQATQDIQEAFSAQLTQKISQADTAISQAQTAISEANTAAQGANEAKQEALEAAEAAESYVLGDISNKTVVFSEASIRSNINTGESTSTLFGKIKKWFSDLDNKTSPYGSFSGMWIPGFFINGMGFGVLVPRRNDVENLTVSSARIFTSSGWHTTSVQSVSIRLNSWWVVLDETGISDIVAGSSYLVELAGNIS
jgi:hypothetical protein